MITYKDQIAMEAMKLYIADPSMAIRDLPEYHGVDIAAINEHSAIDVQSVIAKAAWRMAEIMNSNKE